MPRKPATPGHAPDKLDLDKKDRAILRILQRDNKTPQRKIAEQVNLSTAAVQRRIAAMEATGVIARNVAMLDAEAVGAGITSIVEVQMRDERAVTADAAKKLFLATPQVQQCYYVTGGISFVLVIVTTDMRSYESLTRKLFNENELVSNFRSLLALNRVKTGTEIVMP
ncbi:MAG: Lrp/AsnC family transcriptional regulator [Pseudoxanthomonas sp.]